MATTDEATWDVIVIGAGPAGENAADYARKGGLTVALVEAELVGGECSFWACMPSKALLRPLEVRASAAALPGFGDALSTPVDVAAILARRDAFTHDWDDSSQVRWAEGAGIDVLRGRGRLSGERTVVVEAGDGGAREVRARHAVVLATGTTASVPPLPGLIDARPWTSRDVTGCREIPRRVAILGGGVVACESATWLRGLGAEEVTLIERGDRLLGRTEPFAGELVQRGLEKAGVTVLTGSSVDEVQRGRVEPAEVGRLRGREATVIAAGRSIVVDEVVAALGRRPATSELGLEAVGLEAGGYVSTDDHLTVEGVDGTWLYAVGDVNGRALMTHMGKYQGRVCGDTIAARAHGLAIDLPRFRDLAQQGGVPQVTFTDPQVASVGLTEADARERGHEVATVEYDLGSVAGASLLRDGYEGQAKLVMDVTTETLLGATFVGAEVAEVNHAATVAIMGKVPLDVLWHAVPSYPTVSEIWLRLLEAWRER
jgi:dihydrolipoamide dehydrogenase